MQAKPRTPEETYGPALQKALRAFPSLKPTDTAAKAAVSYEALDAGSGRFQVPFFGSLYHVHWPAGSAVRVADGEKADIATHIILLHYLLTADGAPMSSTWIAFRNLPGGLGYYAAFQGRASQRITHTFGHDALAFETGARALGGECLDFGDSSFLFRLLPRVWLAVVLYLADEEFPAEANVLFDASAEHYLPTEDAAVLGGLLASRLIKAAQDG